MPLPGATTNARAPGSFSPLPPLQASASPALGLRRVDVSCDDDSPISPTSWAQNVNVNVPANHSPSSFTFNYHHSNSSSGSLHNFSRPTATYASTDSPLRTASPLTLPPSKAAAVDFSRGHSRKHSNSQGFFEPSISPVVASGSGSPGGIMPNPNLTTSQIAAQTAMYQGQHIRQRSQTLPIDQSLNVGQQRKLQRSTATPPLLSLTEASGERQNGFGSMGRDGQIYRNGLLGGNMSAAATAANVVFHRSPQTSPVLPPTDHAPIGRGDPEKPSKESKTSKVKLFSRPGKINTKDTKEKPLPSPNKFMSLQRGNQSSTSLADTLVSGGPNMYNMANSSSATIRPIETPPPPPPPEKDLPLGASKDKESKKHHFLSRQKHKLQLSSKDDHHLPLSSAMSNSRPADPNAPSSLYNFSLPPSPGPTATSFAKSMSGLDLRHGGRALREKKKEEKEKAAAAAVSINASLRDDNESIYLSISEWGGPSSVGGAGGGGSFGSVGGGNANNNIYGVDPSELARYGLNNMTADDAWPFLKAKLLIIFEGEDLRLPVEDFNRLVITHLQRCIQKRSPNLMVEDLRDLLATGFSSLDQTLRRTPDDRLIPHLVEMWLFTFTSILPYMQAVFLPLDLEFSGRGPLLNPEQARDFWGAVPPASSTSAHSNSSGNYATSSVPASQILEVRRIVLTTYRDTVILSRFDTLKAIFSRLSLDSINLHAHAYSNLPPPGLGGRPGSDHLSSSPDSFGGRPGTALSLNLDPSFASYNSQGTTVLGNHTESMGSGSGARSRAISNVSYGSGAGSGSDTTGTGAGGPSSAPARPFTPSSAHAPFGLHSNHHHVSLSFLREKEWEANALESKQVTEMVGRMLQCMSVLASVGGTAVGFEDGDAQAKTETLCRALKLNWLGRGRTGRNRRGLVGERVTERKDETFSRSQDDGMASML